MSKQKLPEFNDEQQDWIARALAVMDPKVAVGAFLDTYPHFYLLGFSRDEVKERIYTRFKQAKYDKTRPIYSKIQENIEELHEVLKKYTACFPVLDPIERLNVLEKMRQDPDNINTKLLRVMEIGAKIFAAQSKAERAEYSTYNHYDYHRMELTSDDDDNPYKMELEE